MSNTHHFQAYLHSKKETLQQYSTSLEGIDSEERKRRLEVYGPNALEQKKATPIYMVILAQFTDPMIILLLICAVLARFMNDIRTAAILLLLVVVNAGIGYQQEAKAERLIASLKNMMQSKAKINVYGQLTEIDATRVVPGDIVALKEGDAVVADVRVIESRNLQTNDFALTGESNPKRKHVHTIASAVEIGDRTNLCYMGTTVATGNGLGVVVGTGMATELGRIASLTSNAVEEISPLQKELNHTTVILTKTTIVVGIGLFIVTLLLDWEIQHALLFAIGIGASMVPQGLPAQVNISLASAAGYLAKKNALVKKLSAVETLGAVNVICTDKTGTLTTNEMTVQSVWHQGTIYAVHGVGYEPVGSFEPVPELVEDFAFFLSIGTLCSNAAIREPDKEHPHWRVVGDPTEGALHTLAGKFGLSFAELNTQFPLVYECSFDSSRKRMSMVRELGDGRFRVYVKGSLQTLLPCCTHIGMSETIPLTATHEKLLNEWDSTQASSAMRNLSYAYKEIDQWDESMSMEVIESDLIFAGMVSMIDPPREAVKDAIAAAVQASIKIVIITGDYAKTALAIAHKVGLGENGSEIQAFTGSELSQMSDVQLSQYLRKEGSAIFSRVSPEDKVRIVSHCKKLGYIVAVTGDGVNDAPALKTAHIGVAMGKTGTDVAKEAADIILLDDSFSSLVFAIRQGRIIFQNIQKNILSCITTNRAELFAVLIGLAGSVFTGAQIAITAVQILAIDLIGEMFPLAALSQDPPEGGIMNRGARNVSHHIIHRNAMIDMVLSGLVIGLCGYVGFFLLTNGGTGTGVLHMQGQTLMYVSIVLCQYVNILARRVNHNTFFTAYLWSNKKLLIAMAISLACICCLIYIPVLSVWFGFAALSFTGWVYAIISAIVYGVRRYRVQGSGKAYFARRE